MAGKKRKAAEGAVSEEPPPAAVKAKAEAASLPSSPRRTRSSSARAASEPSVPKEVPVKKSKPSKGKKNPAKDSPEPQKAAKEVVTVEGSTAIVIEACKQCNSFKTRAQTVKEGLEKGVPGIVVTINPEKPRKGCFEIRDASGKIFISLLNMPRPFKKMKELDMEQVIEDIIKKVK